MWFGMKPLPKFLLALTGVAAFSLAQPASVQADIIYQYTGNNFNAFSNPPGPYTTSDFVSVTLAFAQPLKAHMPLHEVHPLGWLVEDGVQAISNLNFAFAIFWIATDASGITRWYVDVTRSGQVRGFHLDSNRGVRLSGRQRRTRGVSLLRD